MSHQQQQLRSVVQGVGGVIFDMDGTLTVPILDFVEMRRRAGVREGQDILHAVSLMEEGPRAAALQVRGLHKLNCGRLETRTFYFSLWVGDRRNGARGG
jgi:hypothetical protein